MSLSILVIERHRTLADSVADALEAPGAPVRRVWRFEDVLTAMRTRPPAVVVTHSTVPDMHGHEVDLLPVLADYPAALVVISSRGKADIVGFPQRAVFLPKPFGRQQLLEAIAQARTRS